MKRVQPLLLPAIFAAGALALAACSAQNATPPVPGASTHYAPAQASAAQSLPSSGAGETIVATVPDIQDVGARDAGQAPKNAPLALALTLRYRNQAQLDRLVEEQSKPGSAYYRHWLSNAEFAASYAPAADAYARLTGALRAAGFQIDSTYGNRTVIDATADVGTVERFFRTTIHRVSVAHAGTAFVNVRPAYAPAELAGTILSVDGLDTIVSVHTDHVLVGAGQPRAQHAGANSRLFGPVSSVTYSRGYGPLAFSAGYDLPVRHVRSGSEKYDGTGRFSGVVIDADFAESDLRGFMSYFKVKRTGPPTKRVLLHGGPPKGDGAGDSVEAVLDVEALVGDAPGTALVMYEIPNLESANITDAYNSAVSADQVDTLNSSFGGCEAGLGTSTSIAWSRIAEQGAAKGMTFHASSGDYGGSLCASAPATSPYVVAVGGTALTVGNDGAWASEVGWSGSGGGISTLFARPSWQAGVPGTVNRGRNVPDVALDADPYSGMAYYYTGTWNTQYNPLGGTSLSSPLFGAAVTEIDEVKNGRVGLGAAALFNFYAANGYGSSKTPYFHDIVQGTNGPYYAQTGYDLVTGIGSPDAWNIAGRL